jgi:hypothetical protein
MSAEQNALELVTMGQTLPGVAEPLNSLTLYGNPAVVDAVLAQTMRLAREAAVGLTADTAKGRKGLSSVAYRVARTKTALDEAGKLLVADIKAQVATIDAERRRIRETLDALKAEIAQPVTQWEAAEAARVAQIEGVLSKLRGLYRPGMTVGELTVALDYAEAVDPATCEERAEEARLAQAQVVAMLVTARQQAIDAEALAAERARLDEERRRLEAEQAAAEAARLAAQRAQEDADRRAAEAAAAAERAALQAAVAQAQQEVARLTVAATPTPTTSTTPTWLVTDEELKQARAWERSLQFRSPTHATLVHAMLAEIDGWRAQESAR